MNYFCFQGNNNDCGFASLKMLLANISRNRSFLYLQKPNKKAFYSYKDLSEIANDYGVSLICYNITDKDIGQIKWPCLVCINDKHIVYIHKIDSKRVVYNDPAEGKKRINISDFINLWNGDVIEVDSIFNDESKKFKKRETRIIPFKMQVIRYLICFASLIILLLGFFYLNKSSSLSVSLIFLTLFVLVDLVDNWYLIKIINYFDSEYLKRYFSKVESKLDDYTEYENFKRKFFVKNKSIISALFVIFLGSFFLILNETFNAIAIFVLLIFVLAMELLSFKKDKKEQNEINKIEEDSISGKFINIDNLLLANKKANQYGLRSIIKKCIIGFLSLLLAFLMMKHSGIVSSNFLIFHFGFYLIISNNFSTLADYLTCSNNFERDKQKFIDRCNL